MKSFRLERVANILAQEIGGLILSGKIKDHRVSPMLSVSHVEVSVDLAYAKVWISSLSDKVDAAIGVQGLQSAAGFIQADLAKKLKTRNTPKLQFKEDHSIEESIRIQNKIKEACSDIESDG